MRKLLSEGGSTREWSPFETELFNLFSKHHKKETGRRIYFSQRVQVCQEMLDAMDLAVEHLKDQTDAS